MSRCPHNRVQQFTDVCLDCGRNVNETDEEYLSHLKKLKYGARAKQVSDEIVRLEKELEIKHPGNRGISSC